MIDPSRFGKGAGVTLKVDLMESHVPATPSGDTVPEVMERVRRVLAEIHTHSNVRATVTRCDGGWEYRFLVQHPPFNPEAP
jgi:hypothetical protein